MRERILKNKTGRYGTGRKEVALRINRSGLSAAGTPRSVVAVRFTDESYKKASKTEYVVPEVDFEEGRLYFTSASGKDGYKLTGSGKGSKYKSITFTVDNIEKWRALTGDYDMLKDVKSNDYYIDFSKR